jgi:ABC-type transport system substrate-binding protein
VKAVDSRRVAIRLKQPTATSLITDMLVGQPVVDMSRNSSEALSRAPASAGPYRVVDWRQGESITFEAFPQWYGGRARTKNVVFRFFTSPAAAVSALVSGEIDVLAYLSPRDGSRVRGEFDILSGYPGAAVQVFRINARTPPFTNKTLRQALSHAVNRERIVKEALFGFGDPAFLPFGAKSPVQAPDVPQRMRYDLGLAKSLLQQIPNLGPGDAMVEGQDQLSVLVMQIIQADLASIGFTLRIQQRDPASYNSMLVAGEFGVALGSVGAGQLSVPRIVQNSLMRTSNNPLWANGTPPAQYSEAMKTLISATDPAVQQRAYAELRDVLVDEAWAVGTYDVPTLWASKRSLKGVARDHQNAIVLANAAFQ